MATQPPAWSKAHACCVDCGTTDRPHYARGRCHPCYSAWYYREHRGERRDYLRRYRADPERHRARISAWQRENRERYLAWSRRNQRERYWRQRRAQGGADGPPSPAPE